MWLRAALAILLGSPQERTILLAPASPTGMDACGIFGMFKSIRLSWGSYSLSSFPRESIRTAISFIEAIFSLGSCFSFKSLEISSLARFFLALRSSSSNKTFRRLSSSSIRPSISNLELRLRKASLTKSKFSRINFSSNIVLPLRDPDCPHPANFLRNSRPLNHINHLINIFISQRCLLNNCPPAGGHYIDAFGFKLADYFIGIKGLGRGSAGFYPARAVTGGIKGLRRLFGADK